MLTIKLEPGSFLVLTLNMSRIECKYCSISTSCLAGLFDLSYYYMFDRIVFHGDFLPMRTLCDADHKEFESH